MSSISGNPVVSINGKAVHAQGIGHIRGDVNTPTAAGQAKTAGVDDMIISYNDKDGNQQRLLVWGDELDFSFRKRERQPNVTVNGRPAMMVSFDDQPNTFTEGAIQGAVQGIKDAADAVVTMAKSSIQGVAVAGGAAMLGGSIWVAASHGAAIQTMGAALTAFGPGLMTAVGGVSLAAVGLVVLFSGIKGGFAALNPAPKMDVVAGIIDDHVIEPQAAAPAAPVVAPAAPAANSRPAANAPVANRLPAANNRVPQRPAAAPAPSSSDDVLLQLRKLHLNTAPKS